MNTEIIAELEDITSKSSDGRLHEADVVKRARNKKNLLHAHFNWNDRKAAHEHRLEQARDLIRRVKVEIQPRKDSVFRVRGFVSLGSDRLGGGGFRPIAQVLSDSDLRAELLRTAIRELNAFKKRYEHLAELSDVITQIENATVAQSSKGEKRARG
jgi:hypothetical protein